VAVALLVGVVVVLLAATGTFESLLALAIVQVVVIDSVAVLTLFRLRRREPSAPFSVPLFPWVPLLFVGVYVALFVGSALSQPKLVLVALGVMGAAWAASGGKGR